MNRKQQGKRAGASSWAVRTLVVGACLVLPGVAMAEEVPEKMKLILSPGSGKGDVIIFSPGDAGIIRREKRKEAVGGEVPAAEESLDSHHPGASEAVVLPTQALGDNAPENPAPDIVFGEQAAIPPAPTLRDNDPYLYRSTMALNVGYRLDNLNWTISDIDGSPNILSELDWKDIESTVLSSELRWSDSSHFYFRGNLEVGWLFNGMVRDSDYLGDDRSEEFSRAFADTEDGSLYDFSGAVGYRFDLPPSGSPVRLHVMPVVGYSWNAQEFDLTHGRQELSDYGFPVEVGEFPGLQASYDTLWQGPWLGVDFELRLGDKHLLTGSYGYYWFDYEGDGDWNLREDFAHPVSFHHDAQGEGSRISLGYHYNLSKDWQVRLTYTLVDISTDSGQDTTYFNDGTEIGVPFNGASWDSSSWLFGIGYTF